MPCRTATLACFALLGAVLAGCAGTPPAPMPAAPAAAPAPPDPAAVRARLLRDDAFAAVKLPLSADDIFEPSPAMLDYLAGVEGRVLREADPRRALVDMLYQRHQLAIGYDASVTRTAAQAFEARAGNCLSLVVMTASFAKALGLPVRFQRVLVEDSWSRSGGLYVASNHVNLTLDTRPPRHQGFHRDEPGLVVDFVAPEDLRGRRMLPLSEATIVSMFFNNRAAEALDRAALDEAYAYARAAVQEDPLFVPAWNTLGVLYQRRGLPADAERVYAYALAQEPDNPKVMANRVATLRQLGRTADAEAQAAALAAVEAVPPFHWFEQGLQAMRERRYADARELFRKEVRREAHYHEFRHWLALSELALGQVAEAQRQLELAREASTTPAHHERYAAKIDRLRALRTQ